MRIPFVPLLACFSALCHLLLFILAGVNVANIYNGGSPLLLAFSVAAEVSLALLYLKKLIGLSTSILRWHKVKGSHDMLNKPDLVLKLIIAASFGCLVAQLVLFSTPPFYITAAMSCLTALTFLFTFGFGWQFQRLIWQLHGSITSESAGFIQPVIWKMRAQQVAGMLMGAPIMVLYLLVSIETLDLSYGIVIFTLGFYRLLELVFVLSRKRPTRGGSKKVDDAGVLSSNGSGNTTNNPSMKRATGQQAAGESSVASSTPRPASAAGRSALTISPQQADSMTASTAD